MNNRTISLLVLALSASAALGQSIERSSIEGWVLDYRAAMVEGAEVAILEVAGGPGRVLPRTVKVLGETLMTDRKGHFRFEIEVDSRHDLILVARKPGLALGWRYIQRNTLLWIKSLPSYYSITLEKSHGIGGRLVDHRGRPVAGAMVQAVAYESGARIVDGPLGWWSEETDAQGRFYVSDLPIEMIVQFYVTVPGRGVRAIFPSRALTGNACEGYRVDWQDVELTLPEGTTLSGRAYDKDTGRGIGGVRWVLRPENENECPWLYCIRDVVTGPDGAFRLTGVPPGRHQIRLVPPQEGVTEWVGSNRSVTVPQTGGTLQVSLPVERGVPVEIHTHDAETGRPLARMWVVFGSVKSWSTGGFVQALQTDAGGRARCYVPAGRHRVHAMGDNYNVNNKEGVVIDARLGHTTPLKIPLRPLMPLIRGTVVDPQRRPAEGVRIGMSMGQSVLTDREGRFSSVQNVFAPARLVVARDVMRDLVGVRRIFKPSGRQNIQLEPGLGLSGRVIGDSDLGISRVGIPGAHVMIQVSNDRVHSRVRIAETLTDPNGEYRLETVWPLKYPYSYVIEISATGYRSTSHALAPRGKAGDMLRVPDIPLVRTDASISGVLLGRDGRPAATRPVFAMSGDSGFHGIRRSTTTDEEGRFVLPSIARGPVTLQGDFPGNPGFTMLHAHSGDHVEMTMGKGTSFFLPATSNVGKPLPDLRQLEIAFNTRRIRNKKVLVCLVDVTQRPSQATLVAFRTRRRTLRRQGVEMVFVQVAPIEEEALAAWKKENKITFPIAVLPGNAEWVKQEWGVRSLPWLTMTDQDHRIIGEGFPVAQLHTFLWGRAVYSGPGKRRADSEQ